MRALRHGFMLLARSGEIMAVNGSLEDSPEVVSQDPYGKGWLIRILPEHSDPLSSLLSPQEYSGILSRS